ncbi:Cki family colicin immunity protein [Escherichia coli]
MHLKYYLHNLPESLIPWILILILATMITLLCYLSLYRQYMYCYIHTLN